MKATWILNTAIPLLLLLASGCSNGETKFEDAESEGTATTVSESTTERCARHDLPVAQCFICDPDLRDAGRLWCGEHGRYEDRCFLCHPELVDVDRLWCSEHNLYEDECFLCHPELRETPSAMAPVTAGLHCGEHDVMENECGICHPELAAGLEPGSGLKIRFESARSAELAGIETGLPTVGTEASGATFLARVTWDQNRFAHVTPLAAGVLRKVLADVGQSVSSGQRLATLNSPEIAELKAAYLAALAEEKLKESVFTRNRGLVEQRISSQQDLDNARTGYEVARYRAAAARQILLDHGLDEGIVLELERGGSPSSDLEVVAPLGGTIVDRHAVAGESVEPGDTLFMIARLDTMWLELSIPERDISLVATGRDVVATFDLHPGLEAHGRVTWVGSSIDPETRMVEARAEVANPGRQLRHGMFGRARVDSSRTGQALWVPGDAVQYVEDQAFVFARLEDDLFELRRVTVGGSSNGRIAIAEGLGPQDEIVVAHSFTLKSELLKSRLGAGCVDD